MPPRFSGWNSPRTAEMPIYAAHRPGFSYRLHRPWAYRFDFVCIPLKFVGATGSPVRPIAPVEADI